jgi:transcriptional regulator with XRE-family HTH domain
MRIRAVRLRELREDQVLSQKELAERAGVDKTTIIRLESGKGGVHPRTVRKLAAVLGVEPRELRSGGSGG